MKTIVAGLGLVFAVAMLVAASPKGEPTYPTYVKEKTLYAKKDFRGLKAPKFAVETWLSGKEPKTKGKVVVIDFWATWCPPCRALIPEMNEWAKKFEKDVVFIGVSNEPAETVRKFMGDTKMEYSVAVDTKRQMGNELGVEGIPHVMIVSADGIVRWQGFPGSTEDPLTAEKIQQIVEASKAGVK